MLIQGTEIVSNGGICLFTIVCEAPHMDKYHQAERLLAPQFAFQNQNSVRLLVVIMFM